MEVFEHLTPEQTRDAVADLTELLAADGEIVVEVPVETGLPGLAKNIYRKFANGVGIPFRLMLRSAIGLPVDRKPQATADGSLTFEHPGYDSRVTRKLLSQHFRLVREYSTPFRAMPRWLNNCHVMVFTR